MAKSLTKRFKRKHTSGGSVRRKRRSQPWSRRRSRSSTPSTPSIKTTQSTPSAPSKTHMGSVAQQSGPTCWYAAAINVLLSIPTTSRQLQTVLDGDSTIDRILWNTDLLNLYNYYLGKRHIVDAIVEGGVVVTRPRKGLVSITDPETGSGCIERTTEPVEADAIPKNETSEDEVKLRKKLNELGLPPSKTFLDNRLTRDGGSVIAMLKAFKNYLRLGVCIGDVERIGHLFPTHLIPQQLWTRAKENSVLVVWGERSCGTGHTWVIYIDNQIKVLKNWDRIFTDKAADDELTKLIAMYRDNVHCFVVSLNVDKPVMKKEKEKPSIKESIKGLFK